MKVETGEKWEKGQNCYPLSPGGSIQNTAGDARYITVARWKQPTLFAVSVAFGASFPRTRGHTLEVLDPITGITDQSCLLVDLRARQTRYRRVRVNHVFAVMTMFVLSVRLCFF